MSDNTQMSEIELLHLYNDVVEGPEYLSAVKYSCPSGTVVRNNCGSTYTPEVSYACCTSSTVCSGGKVTTGYCMTKY